MNDLTNLCVFICVCVCMCESEMALTQWVKLSPHVMWSFLSTGYPKPHSWASSSVTVHWPRSEDFSHLPGLSVRTSLIIHRCLDGLQMSSKSQVDCHGRPTNAKAITTRSCQILERLSSGFASIEMVQALNTYFLTVLHLELIRAVTWMHWGKFVQ